MDNKVCKRCGAQWIAGQLYWSSGKPGTEADLAGLVCDNTDGVSCINELRGTDHGGNTWLSRMQEIDSKLVDHDKERLEKMFRLDS